MARLAIRGFALAYGVMLVAIVVALRAGAWLDSPVISFIAKPSGKQNIFLADSRIGLIHNLTRAKDDVWSFIWSPDGKQLFYTMTDWDEPGDAMIIMDIDGRNVRRIRSNLTLLSFNLVWSPDSRYIAYFASHPRNTGELFIIDVVSGTVENVTKTEYISEQFPSWSPDGTQLAYLRDGDIYGVDIETGTTRPLIKSPQTEANPIWSPDGMMIAFQRIENANGERGLYLFSIEDGTIQHIDSIGSQPSSWSQDSKSLLYSRSSQQVVIYHHPTGEIQVVSGENQRGYDAMWSPDETQVAYISSRAVYSTYIKQGQRRILSGDMNVLAPLSWWP